MSASPAKKKKGKIEIRADLCKECSFCIPVCPRDCIELGEQINAKGYYTAVFLKPDECNGCAICAIMCPEAAIEVYRD